MTLPNQALKCPSAGPSSFLTLPLPPGPPPPPLFLFAPICKWDFCVGLFTECSRCWRLSGLDSHITCQSVLRQGSAMATQAPLTEPKGKSAGASQKRTMAHAHTHTYTEPLTNTYAHTHFTSEESFQCSSVPSLCKYNLALMPAHKDCTHQARLWMLSAETAGILLLSPALWGLGAFCLYLFRTISTSLVIYLTGLIGPVGGVGYERAAIVLL